MAPGRDRPAIAFMRPRDCLKFRQLSAHKPPVPLIRFSRFALRRMLPARGAAMDLSTTLYTPNPTPPEALFRALLPGLEPQRTISAGGTVVWSYPAAGGTLEIQQMPQLEIHEHVMAALAYAGSLMTQLPPARQQELTEALLATAQIFSLSFTGPTPDEALVRQLRKALGETFGGIWLLGEGFFDIENRLILDVEGRTDARAQLPEVPALRRTLARFLFTALNQEREDLEEAGLGADDATPLDVAYARAEYGYQRALVYGFEEEEDIFAFISILFSIGPNFDDHPELRKLLEDASLTPRERLDALVEHPEGERIWDEVESLIDPARWGSAKSPH